MAKKVKTNLSESEKADSVNKIKTKKRFKTKKAFKEYRINNLKRYHFLRKELNGVWDSIPEDKRFRTKKDVLKELVVTYRNNNDYAYISNTFDVALSTVLGYETNEADNDDINYRQLAERDSIALSFPFYMISTILTNLYVGKDVELVGEMYGEPFKVIGSGSVVHDWFRGSYFYRWCRADYNDSYNLATFLLYDYDGLTAKYELVNTEYDKAQYPLQGLFYKDFRSEKVQIPQKQEKVPTIEENKPKTSDKEIELELARERNREKELLLKEFELGLITKKQYEKERKRLNKNK